MLYIYFFAIVAIVSLTFVNWFVIKGNWHSRKPCKWQLDFYSSHFGVDEACCGVNWFLFMFVLCPRVKLGNYISTSGIDRDITGLRERADTLLIQPMHIFLNVIVCSNIVHYNCNISVWNWPNTIIYWPEYLVRTVDTDGLVLQHQGISSYSAEYAFMHFQLFIG